MKILVTGAAGLIGSHLCEQFLKDAKNKIIGEDIFAGPAPTTSNLLSKLTLKLSRTTPSFYFIQQICQ
ncbi:NAD-dependent epimerase/dehydratase family protein [Peribacillus simplex]|uniref:NAD-dependent epimerase/dehydratase family protein n=1 Tax=Peribacillus simplex TaxID=1478 RepID=UPI00366FA606